MICSCSDAKASFNHIILDNVLGRGDGSTPLKLSLSEEVINDIFALSNLTDNDIDSLEYNYTYNGNVITPIQMADCNLLRVFLHFVVNSQLKGNPIIGEARNAIIQEALNHLGST